MFVLSLLYFKRVANVWISKQNALKDVKNYLNSTTELGNHVYENNLDFVNPICILNEKYNKSSLNNLKQYFKWNIY